MTKDKLVESLKLLLEGPPWGLQSRLRMYIEEVDAGHHVPSQRTLPQNSALHLGLGMIADSLNEAGLDIRKVLKPEVEIPWSVYMVKEYLFRPVMKLMTGKDSTKQLDKLNEIDGIWDTVMRFLGQNHRVEYIPFPVNEELQKIKNKDLR